MTETDPTEPSKQSCRVPAFTTEKGAYNASQVDRTLGLGECTYYLCPNCDHWHLEYTTRNSYSLEKVAVISEEPFVRAIHIGRAHLPDRMNVNIQLRYTDAGGTNRHTMMMLSCDATERLIAALVEAVDGKVSE